MNNKQGFNIAEYNVVLARLFGLLLLTLFWINSSDSEGGVVLLLLLTILAIVRWRFNIPKWFIFLDIIICFAVIPLWPFGVYGLILPFFEAALVGSSWLIIPGVIWIAINSYHSLPLILILTQAVFVGWLIRSWTVERKLYVNELDEQRKLRYEIEEIKNSLVISNQQVAKMAELSERNRIAQQLHDEVGHELTAAVLALQAFEQLWEEGDPLAKEMFDQGQKRLSNSAIYLRETVHNIKPVKPMGIEELRKISQDFNIPISFKSYGDDSAIPVHIWSILQNILKEALTNVAKHSNASKVDISLDISPYIARLSVKDDGKSSKGTNVGMGLRNIRQRLKAIGGSLSIDTTDGFQLICVLPIEKAPKP